MGVKTIFKKDHLKEYKRRLELETSGASVSIGIQQDEGAKEKKSSNDQPARALLVEVATFQEFGTEHIPQRSFIRANDLINRQKYQRMIKELKDKILFEKMPVEKALGLLGEVIKADIKKRIVDGISPALKAKTIERKGSSTPLIDTAQMLNAIDYKVKKGKNK